MIKLLTKLNFEHDGIFLHGGVVLQSCETEFLWKPGFVKSGHILLCGMHFTISSEVHLDLFNIII